MRPWRQEASACAFDEDQIHTMRYPSAEGMGEGVEAEIEIRQVYEASDFPPEIVPAEEAAREQELRDELEAKAGRP